MSMKLALALFVIPDLIRDPCQRTSFTVRAELPVLSSVEGVEACADPRFRGPSCKPGLAPAGEALFFASPKKSTQKKGDPMVWVPCAALRGNLRCSPKAGSRSNSPSAQTIASPDPLLPALLGPARRVVGSGAGSGGDALRAASPLRIRLYPPSPFGRAEQRRWRRCQGRQLFEPKASSADPRRNRAAQVARSEAKGPGQQGRLSFAYFSLARQRKVSCRRATPGLLSGPTTGSFPTLRRNSQQNMPPALVWRAQSAIYFIASKSHQR